MGRTRYKIYEPTHPHFVTCTILHWLPIFTRKEKSFQVLEEGYQPNVNEIRIIMLLDTVLLAPYIRKRLKPSRPKKSLIH